MYQDIELSKAAFKDYLLPFSDLTSGKESTLVGGI
jgi:hypothetical protein